MLISDIRDEVIGEVGGDSDDSELKTKIVNFILAGLRRFPLHCRSRLLLRSDYTTLSAGAQSLTMPDYFVRERQVYLISGNNRVNILKGSSEDFNVNYTSGGSGDPTKYRIIGNTLEFDRQADAAKTIYIEYFKEVDIDAGGSLTAEDTFFGSNDMAEVLKDLVKGMYMEYQEDDARAERFFARAKEGLEEIDASYQRSEIPSHIEEY